MCNMIIMDNMTTYLLKLEKSEKDEWASYAKENQMSLARLIRVAVTRMIHGEKAEIAQSEEKMNQVVERALQNSSLISDVKRMESAFHQLTAIVLGQNQSAELLKIRKTGANPNDF